MPQLSDLIGKSKFVKKEFRPWDLSGTGTIDNKSNASPEPEIVPVAEKNIVVEKKISINEKPIVETATAPASQKTGNITGNKQVTTREQPGNNKVTKNKQPGNIEVTTREHLGNDIDNVTGNTETFAYLVEAIKKLSGIQKNIFLYIVTVCSAKGALDTGNVLANDLANNANCSIGSAKTSLIRLIEKHLVRRLQGKPCRGGHMVLGITKEIQAAAIQAQHALFKPLKLSQTGNVTGNISDNINPYSSSIYKNNTTTSLPEDWKKINYDLLGPIGFSETQLCQLYESGMTGPEIIQDAINRFAYSLKHSDKTKAYTDPLNVLMGVLRKGQRWNEPNYISPKELALRQILEEKRKQKEAQDTLIKELVEIEFPEWRKKLADSQIKLIVPEEILKMNLSSAITASLRTYYVEKILIPKLEKDEIIPK